MAPKRKSNALEPEAGVVATLQDARNTEAAGEAGPSTKKARADVSDAPASKGKKGKEPTKPRAGTTSPLRGRKRTRYRSTMTAMKSGARSVYCRRNLVLRSRSSSGRLARSTTIPSSAL
ncbi:hypothetical protein AcV7_000522 [Taiwanofungus camphoratus]|nr:hypothetical protein AcV7_000522 [Antrodia cinnamomea]